MMISVIFASILVSACSAASWVVPKIVSMGFYNAENTCWLRGNGEVKCWGPNGSGQLGLGDRQNRGDDPDELGASWTAIDLGAGRSAVQIAVGAERACAVLDNGQLKSSWATGTRRIAATSPTRWATTCRPSTSATAVRRWMSLPRRSTPAHCSTTVKCWGSPGILGAKLGYGDSFGLQDANRHGDEPNEMGDNLPAVDLGAGQSAVQIAAGEQYTCVVLANGQLKCWGSTHGYGDNNGRGDDLDQMGDNLPAVDLGAGRSVVQFAAGEAHSCTLLDNGQLKCWGSEYFGHLGYGDKESRGNNPDEMGDNLPAVDLGGGQSAVQIALGDRQTCAVLANGQLKCWGQNSLGQLGYGDKNDRGDEPNEMGDNLPAVDLGDGRSAVQVTAGWTHMCALLDNGEVTCWGRNNNGQLGRGDSVDFYEMGDKLKAIFRVMTSTTATTTRTRTSTSKTLTTTTTSPEGAPIDAAKSRSRISGVFILLGTVSTGLEL